MSDLWMTTWLAMVNNRDRPREGARGAQRTHRGGPEGAYKGAPASTHRGGPEGAYRGDPATCRCCDLKIVYWFIDKIPLPWIAADLKGRRGRERERKRGGAHHKVNGEGGCHHWDFERRMETTSEVLIRYIDIIN